MKLIESTKEHAVAASKQKTRKASKGSSTKKTARRAGKKQARTKGNRTGRFTYFPDKTVTRSWRVTKKTDDLLRDTGKRIKDEERDDREVGATDILEAAARLYLPKMTMKDIKAAISKS